MIELLEVALYFAVVLPVPEELVPELVPELPVELPLVLPALLVVAVGWLLLDPDALPEPLLPELAEPVEPLPELVVEPPVEEPLLGCELPEVPTAPVEPLPVGSNEEPLLAAALPAEVAG